jgi:hypothetical protein
MNRDMQVATAEASRRATVLRESCQRYRQALRQLQHRQRRASAASASYSEHDAAHHATARVSIDAAAASSSRSRPRTASASAGIADDFADSSSLQSNFAQACSMGDSHSLTTAATRPATAGASIIGDTQPQLSRALCKELAAYSTLRTTYLNAVNTDSAVLSTAGSQAQCAFMAVLNPPPPQPPDPDYLQWSPCAADSCCSKQGGGQASGNEEPCYTSNSTITISNSNDTGKRSSSSSTSSSRAAAAASAADHSASTTAATATAAAAAGVIDYAQLQQWVQYELRAVPSGGAAGAAAEGDARAAKGRPSSAASLALLFKDW